MIMKLKIIIPVFAVLLLQQAHSQNYIDVHSLLCEMRDDPTRGVLGIEETKPRLSWKFRSDERNVYQTAYHIIVSSSAEKAKKDEGDIWNSGKVNSSQSYNVVYGGKPLTSRMNCYWKEKVYTNKGEGSLGVGQWSMGLLNS